MQLALVLLMFGGGQLPALEVNPNLGKHAAAAIFAAAHQKELEKVLSSNDHPCEVYVPVDVTDPVVAIVADSDHASFAYRIIGQRFSGRPVKVFVGEGWSPN